MLGRVLLSSNLKKDYLLKNGKVNSDFIGTFLLPVGTLTSEGIKIKLGGGFYQYQFKTSKSYSLHKEDILIFECGGSLAVAFTIPYYTNNLVSFGAIGSGIKDNWRVAAILNKGMNEIVTDDIFNINSANPSNFVDITIKSIYIIRKFSGGGVLNPLIKNGITFLRKVVSNMLGRVLGVGNKSIYPAGYKYKRGSLLETNTLMNIPSNVIPLTIQLNGASGRALNYDLSLDANPTKTLFSFSGYGTGNYNGGGSFGTTFINLLALYDFDFDELKQVKTITENVSFRSGSMSRANFKIVEWLEKVGV